ncbi:MAG: hypothetical protein R3336_06745 [Phycisphaeraceae bacterium]|nr:hypothetical protein [Phycisphaeraceae bacterium]
MRISIHNEQRKPRFDVEVDLDDPPTRVTNPDPQSDESAVLNWDRAIDDEGHLRHCPVCGCQEMFVRKDFPQVTGFAIVLLAAVLYLALIGFRYVTAAFLVLAIVVAIDVVIYLGTGRCLVCYRCRSEFRGAPIGRDQSGWDLATGEKYRQVENPDA